MLAELTPILNVAKLNVYLELTDGNLIVTLKPTMLNDKLCEDAQRVLGGAVTKKYPIAEFDNDKFFQDLMDWQNVVIDGETNLADLEAEIKKLANEKKTKAKPKPKAAHKPKPKKKTKAELEAEERAKLRAKQAEDKKGQGDLFSGDRMSAEQEAEDIATKAEEKKELKTAVEKAEEKADLSLEDL